MHLRPTQRLADRLTNRWRVVKNPHGQWVAVPPFHSSLLGTPCVSQTAAITLADRLAREGHNETQEVCS